MTQNDVNSEDFDLDRALTAAEREVWGPLVDASEQILPTPEFARSLEARLRALEPPRVPARAGRELAVGRPHTDWRDRVFGKGGLRPALAGVALALVMVMLFGALLVLQNNSHTVFAPANYIPQGKVRHLVIEHTTSASSVPGGSLLAQAPTTITQESWLTNGASHPIMYYAFTPADKSPYGSAQLWVTDDAVYNYGQLSTFQVLKYPYNPSYTNRYMPDPGLVASWLNEKQLSSRLVAHVTLDGRPVAEIATAAYTMPTAYGDRDLRTAVDHVWIDTSENIMVKLHRETTYVSGADKGRVETFDYHLVKDELLDRSALSADFFDFKLPAGAKVVDSVDPVANPLTPGVTPSPVASQQGSSYLPSGKVRHMKFSHTWDNGSFPNNRTEEVWVANGANHPVMRLDTPDIAVSRPVKDQGLIFMWVTGDAIYANYKFDTESVNTYLKYPYDPALMDLYFPRDMQNLISAAGANHTVTDTLLDNSIPVTLLESTHNKPAVLPPPDPSKPETWMTDVRLWVDKATSLVLKQEYTTTYLSGPRAGTVQTEALRLLSNELIDESTLAPGFFAFTPPAGSRVVNASAPMAGLLTYLSPSAGLPTPTPDAWSNLRIRSLDLPTVASGESCPATSWANKIENLPPLLGKSPVYLFGAFQGNTGEVQLTEKPSSDGWYDLKAVWLADLGYTGGPVLVRGKQLDGMAFVRFQLAYNDPVATELLLNGTNGSYSPSIPGGWHNWPSGAYVPGPGCYGLQVDGENFTESIVFRVLPGSQTPAP